MNYKKLISPDKSNAKDAYNYAYRIIRGRWKEGESIIMKNPRYAYFYAYHIMGCRWPEAEKYIMKDSEFTYLYAWNVIKGPWPEAEPHLDLADDYWAGNYYHHLKYGSWVNA